MILEDPLTPKFQFKFLISTLKKNKFKKSLFFLLMPVFIWLGTNFILTNSFIYSVSASDSADTVTVSASLFESLLKKIDSLVAEVSSLKKTVADFVSGKKSADSSSNQSESTQSQQQSSGSESQNSTSSESTSGSTSSGNNALDNLSNAYGGNSGQTGNTGQSSNKDTNAGTNKSLTSEIGDWFKKVLGLDKQKSQTPSSGSQPSSSQQQPSSQPAQQQQQQSGQQQQGGQENGTGKNPYKLEPNQFKKICGQNTYVLYYRIGGIGKRDMLKPTAKEGTGAGGKEDTGEYTFEIPSCSELAKCHCCCNTCQIPETLCQKPGWVFAKKGCVPGCSDKCEANCKKGCKDWKKPTPVPGAPFDRDCDCQMEGCPDGKDCMILIKDEGNSKLQYTTKEAKPEQYFPAAGFAYFKNGNGPSTDKSKIKSDGGNDTKDQGWIKKLKEEPGICCGCIQDAQ